MMTEKESFIQLEKSNVFIVKIKNSDGEDTGKQLEFDLEDMELFLRLNECDEAHKRNMKYLKDQFMIIDKKQDHKGKKLLSWKEEEKLKVLQKVYKDEMDALDLFIGKGKTQMILDLMGRKPYFTMYDDIGKLIEPILPKLKINVEGIKEKITKKYNNKETDVLE
jgi:hypothetical protein